MGVQNRVDESDLLQEILQPLGLSPAEHVFLAQGSVSRAWLVHYGRDRFVLRLAQPHPGKTPSFEVDTLLRRKLHERGSPVAEPIATGTHHSSASHGIPWALDRFMEGQTYPRGELPASICRAIGVFLAQLHELTGPGYGLLRDSGTSLHGQADEPREGILTRLQDPWPDAPLDDHPLAVEAPELRKELPAIASEVIRVALDDAGVVTHTDLHERQFLCANETLGAVLDFSDAVIGPAIWDIASFGYFHGWGAADSLLEGYGAPAGRHKETKRDAAYFAILIAMHHLSRSRTLRKPERARFAASRLRASLGVLRNLE